MKKYIVVKEWLGSKPVGTVIELDKVHPSLEANLRLVSEVDSGSDADLKKENTAIKSKLTKTENVLKEQEEQNSMLQGRIVELENKVIELESKDEDQKVDKK